jgi:hypothetical protein
MVGLMFRRVFLTLFLTWCGLGAPSFLWALSTAPKKSAYLKPVKILASRPTVNSHGVPSSLSIEASYRLACGETFLGVSLRETHERGRTRVPGASHATNRSLDLEIGVVVEKSEAFCSSLPQIREFSLPVRMGSKVRTVKLLAPKRVVLDEVLDVGISQQGMVLGISGSCQGLAGVLLKPFNDQNHPKLDVALARYPKEDSGSVKVPCNREIKQLKIKSIHWPANYLSIAERPVEIKTSYFMRLVSPRQISRLPDGRVSVRWQRKCREHLLGLLFAGEKGRDVAVVTAVMPTFKCRSAKNRADTFVLPGLTVVGAQALRPIEESTLRAVGQRVGFNYSILPAAKIELPRAGEGGQLTVKSRSLHCSRPLGVLVGSDVYGNLAAGQLVGSADAVCTIRHTPQNLSLSAPLVGAVSGPLPRVFGLRVFGTSLN